MTSFAPPPTAFQIRGRIPILASIAAGSLIFAAGVAAAACPVPRITQLTERTANCNAATCGFIIVHWAGTASCDHYNIKERSAKQFEASGTDRNQLHNQRSVLYPIRFAPNNTIHVAIQGCTRNIFGSSNCSAWSPEVSVRVGPAPTTPPTAGRWAALAANGKGNWGYAIGIQSEAQARDAALKGCSAADCKVELAGQYRCYAYYDARRGGAYWYGMGLGNTIDAARVNGHRGCARGAPPRSCTHMKSQCG